MIDENNPLQQDPQVQASSQKKEDPQTMNISRQMTELLSRMRMLEERYTNLRREHQLTNQNSVEHHQRLNKQQRSLMQGVTDVKRALSEVQEEVGAMQVELSGAAKSFELKVLSRYLDLWEPLTFLTAEQAEHLINEKLSNEKVYKSPEGVEDI